MIDSVEQDSQELERSGPPLSVAYVVHTFNFGGLERCVARLVNELDRRQFAPSIIVLGYNGTAARWIDRDDVPIIELQKKPGNDLGVVRRLARTLRSLSVDIVHSHNWGTLVETLLARKLAGTPVHVHAERGMELDALHTAAWKRKLRGRATRWALERTDCVVAVAEEVRGQVLRRCGGLTKEVLVVPNGVTRPAVDPAGPTNDDIRRQYHIGPAATIIGSVGRLVPVKDFQLAVAAVSRLRHRGRDVHLLLVGQGPELEPLTAQADALGVADRVHFAGERDDVGNWLAAMDVYVNCSLNEGMSQSVLEAMGAGLPLVVTDVGDSALLLGDPPTIGRVVRSGDCDALADALDELIVDDEQRRRLGAQALVRHQQEYSLEIMVERYESLYEELAVAHTRRNGRTQATEFVK